MRSGYSHDQDRHLFIARGKAAPLAIVQGGEGHGACVYRAHSILKGRQPLLHGSYIRNKHRIILSGKCIVETVLQDAAGADDDRSLSVVFQKMQKLLLDLIPERTVHKRVLQLTG